MKKTIISTALLLVALSVTSLQSCNSEKKEAAATDSLSATTPDTTIVDSTAARTAPLTDTTDTGGRAGQAPPAVKN
ncbi:hypothetical protein [Pedobacter sp.]|uniref:hypothetical protein n=1 Tax=Pedobacter sp. TaxID=1411316 RepID=UPI003BACF93F